MRIKMLLPILLFFCTLVGYAETIVFKDDSFIDGRIVKKRKDFLILKVKHLKVYTYRKRIESIRKAKSKKLSKTTKNKIHKILKQRKKLKTKKTIKALSLLGNRILPYILRSKKYKKYFTGKRILKLLWHWKNSHTLPTLISYLKNEKYKKRSFAILKSIQNMATIHIMLQLLKQGHFPAEIISYLETMQQKRNYRTTYDILRNHIKRIKKWKKKYIHLIFALGTLQDSANRELIRYIIQNTQYPNEILFAAIKVIGMAKRQDSVVFLKNLFEKYQKDKDICQMIILALGNNQKLQAIPFILEVIPNYKKNSNTYSLCYWALKNISKQKFKNKLWIWKNWWENKKTSIEEERIAYQDLAMGDSEVALEALKKLQSLKSEETVEKIIERLKKENNPIVIIMACHTLTQMHSHAFKAIPILMDFLEDFNSAVSRQAYHTLKKISYWYLPKNYDIWNTWWNAYSDKSNRKLIDLLNSENKTLLILSLNLIGKRKERQAIDNLMNMLDKLPVSPKEASEKKLIRSIFTCLTKVGASRSVPSLIPFLQSKDKGIKRIAWRLLKNFTRENIECDYRSWDNWLSDNEEKYEVEED